jgi:hypothetical protein
MRILKSKKGIALLAVLAVAAVTAIGAYAYFTTTGSGSGSASVGTDTPWEVTTDAATGGPLTPGGPSESIAYHVKNPSTGYQNLANVAIKVANANGTAWDGPGTCSAADFSVDGAAAGATFNDTALAGDKAPGTTSNGSITIQMVDTGSNQDDCKNAIVPLYLYAS